MAISMVMTPASKYIEKPSKMIFYIWGVGLAVDRPRGASSIKLSLNSKLTYRAAPEYRTHGPRDCERTQCVRERECERGCERERECDFARECE